MRSPFLPPLLFLLSACPVGTGPGAFGAAGARVVVTAQETPGRAVDSTRFTATGELLAADSQTMLVLTNTRRLVRIPLRIVRDGSIAHGPNVKGKPLTSAQLERIRALSRYPQGISDELMAALLQEYQQDSVRTRVP